MTTVELLQKAKEHFASHPKCTGAYACNKDGRATNPLRPDAESFCAVGSLMATAGEARENRREAIAYLYRAANKLGYVGAADLNDGTPGKAKVLKMYDLAISMAEEESQ